MISFDGVVVALLKGGRRGVRLANDHLVDASPAWSDASQTALAAGVGQAVRVQLRPGDLGGWRLASA